MRPRDGVTLVEVLVAIFVMAIGLLALLVLFPLGALQMAQAVRDDRAAHAASNAEAIADATSMRLDTAVQTAFGNAGNSLTPLYLQVQQPAGWSGSGYPVFVDASGVLAGFTSVGSGASSPGIPRVAPAFAQTSAGAMQFFTLKDDYLFDVNGQPQASGGLVNRQTSYTWAYLMRPPHYSCLNSSTAGGLLPAVNVSIVVFSGRSTIQQQEVTYQTDFTQGATGVTINYGTLLLSRPAIKKGGYILDATMTTGVKQTISGTQYYTPDPHGFFYRVADLIDTVDGNGNAAVTVQIEGTIHQSSTSGAGQLVVLDNVILVVDKGPGWIP